MSKNNKIDWTIPAQVIDLDGVLVLSTGELDKWGSSFRGVSLNAHDGEPLGKEIFWACDCPRTSVVADFPLYAHIKKLIEANKTNLSSSNLHWQLEGLWRNENYLESLKSDPNSVNTTITNGTIVTKIPFQFVIDGVIRYLRAQIYANTLYLIKQIKPYTNES